MQASTWRPGSADTRTCSATAAGGTWVAATSNCSTSSRSAMSVDSNTFVRHCSWAAASAASSLVPHATLTCTATGRPSPPPSRNASTIARSWPWVLADGQQAVGPATAPARRLWAEGGAVKRRHGRRSGPEAGPVDADQTLGGHLFAAEQGADDADALQQPGVTGRLGRPAIAGDVLVRRLAGAEGHHQPAGEQVEEGGDRLGDDRRVVALAGGVHHAEGHARGGHRRP